MNGLAAGRLALCAVALIAASALAWGDLALVRGRRLAARYDRRYQENLAARGRLPRT